MDRFRVVYSGTKWYCVDSQTQDWIECLGSVHAREKADDLNYQSEAMENEWVDRQFQR